MSSKSKNRQWHTDQSQEGKGDYYGSGVKNPVGRVRMTYMDPKPAVETKQSRPIQLA